MKKNTPEPKISREEAETLIRVEGSALAELMRRAAALAEAHHGREVTYSRKVFIPLTNLCRNRCGYCTFRHDPGQEGAKTLSPEEVLAIAREGAARGCKEALFSLGDKPELIFPEVAGELADFGYSSMVEYLAAMSRLVLEETGLLPHLNPGALNRAEMAVLRERSAGMGVMLENISPRFNQPGMPHHRAPDKAPQARLDMLRWAGEEGIPFTTGLLIGIGETADERLDALFAIRKSQQNYGHIQEVIIQNFRAKPGSEMADHPDAVGPEFLRALAVARLVLGGEMNLQAPPNLSPGLYPFLLLAGINDWGGISPVTPDHINPEAPWPEIEELARRTAEGGYALRERLTLYPEYIKNKSGLIPEAVRDALKHLCDEEGYAIH